MLRGCSAETHARRASQERPGLEDYRYILWEIGARRAYLKGLASSASGRATLNMQALADRNEYWQRLIAGMPGKRVQLSDLQYVPPNTMAVDLTARWNQDSPYNDLCPNL